MAVRSIATRDRHETAAFPALASENSWARTPNNRHRIARSVTADAAQKEFHELHVESDSLIMTVKITTNFDFLISYFKFSLSFIVRSVPHILRNLRNHTFTNNFVLRRSPPPAQQSPAAAVRNVTSPVIGCMC